MPGTTRYSATFDRTYEEDDRVGPAPLANPRRSRSQSWQAHSGLDGSRPYTPLGIRPPSQRSSSTDSGAKAPDQIPTRTVANAAVKAHNNPFQFVKVGTCPLYKKAEEQLKKTKEVKKQDVFREEEEDWQSNLDSWKSRRRKMSEDVFRRQEEIKQFELEEQSAQATQKKVKTFSEMVEQRAHRGRALSLCLISNPLEFQDWEFENKSNTNGSCSTFTDESEENSTVNSEDEGVSLRGRSGRPAHHDNQKNLRTNGDAHIEQNGSSKLETQNGDYTNGQMKPKEYVDSGLESISSSSHRAGDTPDSGSDFSQDSNSSIDCESPRTGVNILEEFSSKSLQMSGEEVSVKLNLSDKAQGIGFEFQGGKDIGQVVITSVTKGSKADCCGVHVGDQIMNIEGSDVSSKTHTEIVSLVQRGLEKKEINLLLWRHTKITNGFNTEEKHVESPVKPNKKDNQNAKSESHEYEKSIESENEMYVDDFEELQRQSELLTSSKKSETNCTNSQAQSDGKKSIILSSEKDSVNSAPKLIEPVSNGTVDKQNANEKDDSEISTESPKKNIVKVKRVRRKGVYALDVSGTPNTIPQEGIPVGSLFPLSPVSELPSPADETKTMSSTLSSKPTTPVSNAQNGIIPKETEVKFNSSIIKENNKTLASEPKTIISKTTIHSEEPKVSLSETVDDKTDSSSIPSSSTVTKSKDIALESSVEEKPKLPSSPKKVKVKVKKATTSSEQKSSESSVAAKETPSDSTNQPSDLSVKKLAPESLPKKEQKSDSLTEEKSVKANKTENLESSQNRENIASAKAVTLKSDMLPSSSKDQTSSINVETSTENTRNLSLKINTPNGSTNTSPVTSAKTPKTPVEEKSKPPFAPKKEKAKPKENNAGSSPVISEAKSVSLKSKTPVTVSESSADKTKNLSLKIETQSESPQQVVATSLASSNKLPKTPQDEKAKSSLVQKKETKSKNTNSQKVNTPAKQNEELMNLNVDSLNVIFQSEPKNSLLENQSFNNKNSENNSNKKAAADLVPDIPPVEKVAEEMEKLILEQLEEEERAKELCSQLTKNSIGSPEHLLTAPPRLAEPPKEKPPPPPSANEGSQKDSSLKRVNSTKRIKKEIHKRRSNFLGIDNVDESIICSESSIPPPPALEEILKAEMELDRQSRLKIESAAIERLSLEEKEIMQKEREIIESLECEERQKQLLNGTEGFHNALPSTPNDVFEDDRISSLKHERKRIETERLMTEEQQQLNLLEEKQLREREEFIRKQEAGKSAGSHSDSSLSVAAIAPNNSKPAISSLTETKPKVSLSDSCGDGGNVTSNSTGVSENKSSEGDGKAKPSEKPAVPPKPLKKKEAIRKERERLRQEQEALQREREEHRRKLMLEQEELVKQQKSHAPDAPVTQLGPLPPLVPPSFPPQLTTTINATPNARDSASFPSRSHHGASNGTAGIVNAGELMGPLTARQNRLPASRKAVQNEAWVQQKMPSVRKQNHDSLTESRYNQNHWLIQEAEMRRITELKERQQRTTQLPCSQTHLAEDDVCSNPSRVPVIQPPTNPHLNYAAQDKMWNYGQPSVPPKKYPPPVVKEPLHTVYPREAVSQQPPSKPSRSVPMERQEQMLSVSGRKRCSHCNEELGRGAAMIIESLQLYYHIHCFQCCVCQAQLGNGSCGTDVRVRNNKLHCHNCYSNDEAGLKFSQV